MTRSLITGVTGQDGYYLAGALLAAGNEVHGVVRAGSRAPDGVLAHESTFLPSEAAVLIASIAPDEVYNLAAVSSVYRSWQDPRETASINGELAAELMAAALRLQERSGNRVTFVQASSSEIFGDPTASPQDETTTIRPTSPYGAAKAYAHHLVGVYRGAGLAASSCILYNHESPRRSPTFVTRKITQGATRIAAGLQDRIKLGNLDSRRDWGWAPDYADALRLTAASPEPRDFVIATGVSHSVGDFARVAFERVGIADWRSHIEIADELIRTGDAVEQVGDAGLARAVLGWEPTLDFEAIVAAMIDADVAQLKEPTPLREQK